MVSYHFKIKLKQISQPHLPVEIIKPFADLFIIILISISNNNK